MVQECLHPYHTQMNESINLRITKYAPKNKHFGATTSLDTLIPIVIGIVNMGHAIFYNTLIDRSLKQNNLSIEPLKNNICWIDENKHNDSIRGKTNEFQRRRRHGREAKKLEI